VVCTDQPSCTSRFAYDLWEGASKPEAQDAVQLREVTGCVPEPVAPIGADVAIADHQPVVETLEVGRVRAEVTVGEPLSRPLAELGEKSCPLQRVEVDREDLRALHHSRPDPGDALQGVGELQGQPCLRAVEVPGGASDL